MNSGGKPKAMIVVPNPTLLDNHQQELAVALGDMHYLFPSTVEWVTLARPSFRRADHTQ
jgi:UDP-N-acetylglucosamine transferase subunit ALG13